jgi:PAS domain S-box-containing protein
VIKKRKVPRRRPSGLAELRRRLHAAEETLRALRAGEVDALVVSQLEGEHVITLQGADLPYRILLDQMYAGAVTMTADGTIVYCNRRFADIVRLPLARVIGSPISRFVLPAEQPALATLLEGAGGDPPRGELAFRAGDGTLVPVSVRFAPLRLGGSPHVQGVIGVVVDDTERKHQEQLRARLVRHAMSAEQDERRRIARELHDETGQSLTALLVGLRTIEGSRTMAEAAGLAQHLRETVAQTLHEVGRLARGLHASVLDDVGLAAAVTRHAEEFARVYGVPVDVVVDGPEAEPLPPLLQTTLYRLLQEALTNVAKHADAHHVSVQVARDDGTVELRVQDDGIGFAAAAGRPASPRGHGGLGLQGMRERAALLGGAVEVQSQPGEGTTITARFPVDGA